MSLFISWPAALPQEFKRDSYQEQMVNNVVVAEFEAGPAGLRRRVTANVYTFSGSMLMTTAQWEAMQLFLTEETLDRSLCFGFPEPGNCDSPPNELLVFMDRPPSRSWLAEDYWLVTTSFVVLPGGETLGALLVARHDDTDTFYAPSLSAVGGALALLSGEAEGFAIDATTEDGTVAVIDTGTPANNLSNVTLAASNLVQTGTSAKVVRWNDGTLHTIAAGEVAQEYDGTRFGILIERSATNLVLRSQEHATSPWFLSPGVTSVTVNAAVAPDGTTTAEKLVETNGSTQDKLLAQNAITVSSGVVYTLSAYVHADERSQSGLGFSADDFSGGAFTGTYDLPTETWLDAAGQTFGSGATNVGRNAENIGNGWHRISITGSIPTNSAQVTVGMGDGGNANYTGDGVSGLFTWGVQLEPGDVATSYIATAGTAVTRNPDIISCATSTYPHDNAAGTFVAWFRRRSLNGANDRICQVNNGTDQERVVFRLENSFSPDKMCLDIVDGGATQVDGGGVTNTGTVSLAGNRAAAFYTANDSGVLADGGSEVVDNSCTMPTTTSFQLGYANDVAARELNGYLYQLTYVPRRMTEAEMQAATT